MECEDSKLKWNVVSRSRQKHCLALLTAWELFWGTMHHFPPPSPIMLGDEYAPGNWSAASTRARDLTNFTWPCFHHCMPLPPPCCLRLGTHLKGKEACSDIRSRPSSRCGCYFFHFVCVCVCVNISQPEVTKQGAKKKRRKNSPHPLCAIHRGSCPFKPLNATQSPHKSRRLSYAWAPMTKILSVHNFLWGMIRVAKVAVKSLSFKTTKWKRAQEPKHIGRDAQSERRNPTPSAKQRR